MATYLNLQSVQLHLMVLCSSADQLQKVSGPFVKICVQNYYF